jgi:hypothetical protein
MTREPTPIPAYDPALEALFPRYDDSKEVKWIESAHKGEAETEQQPDEQEQERK